MSLRPTLRRAIPNADKCPESLRLCWHYWYRKSCKRRAREGTRVEVLSFDGKSRSSKVNEIFGYEGLNRVPIDKALTGDIVAITGLSELKISDTVCDMDFPERLPG